LNDVEVITATIDLEEVRSYREQKSRAMQTRDQPKYERVEVESKLSSRPGSDKQEALTRNLVSLSSEVDEIDLMLHPSPSRPVVYNTPEEEIAYGPACYLVSFRYQSISYLY
jgi:NAD+ synthase (glutamine-hydrolysing)